VFDPLKFPTCRVSKAFCLASFSVLFAIPAAIAFEPSLPPTAEERRKVLEQGFAASLQEIESALTRAYSPEKNASSAKNAAFVQWMDLWRWCDLLSRDVASEERGLVQRHFLRRTGSGEIILCLPGVVPPPDAAPLRSDEVASLAAASNVRQAIAEQLLPSGAPATAGQLGDIAGTPLASAIMSDPDAMRSFLSTWDSRDFAPLVLKNLRSIHEAHPTKWREYADLAIAIAVVNDSALPPHWPHQQVRPDLVPRDIPSAAEQFRRWVDANDRGRLLLDLRRFTADQLTFVVDAFLLPSETAWAQQNISLHVGVFGRAFRSIRYRDDRIKQGRFFWTQSPYTFAAIRKNGGICIDQAYFAAYTGKALGLPTVLFNGQGSNGGHAWFGYMGAPNKWELDCGRDPEQNLVTGIAFDPRTWEPVSDHDLRQLAARFRSTPAFLASTNDLAMARIFLKSGDTARAAAALENATRTCPQNPDAWMRWTEFLETSGALLERRIRVHEQAAKALSRDPDSKVVHQKAVAALLRQSGNSAQATAAEQRILSQNLGKRADLSCEAAASRVREALATEGIDQAATVFHAQLRTIGKTGGGNFVKEVGLPFVSALIEKGQKSRALRTVDIMRQQFAPQTGSPLDLVLKEMTRECK
jgi:hypothetical protein